MSDPSKPNILLVVPDGMQAGTVFPDSQCHTPNFDRLAARGVRFRRAHTSSPTCSPARASLMTGLLPHNHGVLEVEHGKDDDQCVLRTDKPHWAQRLVENGYRTGYFGKWHIERTNKLDDFGWQQHAVKDAKYMRNLGKGSEGPQPEIDPDFCRHVDSHEGYNKILHYAAVDLGPEDRYPGVSLKQSQEFLTESIASGEPWACCLSFSEPNESLIAGKEALSHYDVDQLELPASLRDDYSNRPNLYRRVHGVFKDVTDREWREALACYYARITELDQIFGKVYDQLEAAGQLDNTIIILAADHGRYVGSHGFDAHNFGPFEEIYRIPMIVSGPGIAEDEESDALVGFHDLCPTLLELTGSESIDSPDSNSFAGELRSPGSMKDAFDEGYAEFFGARFCHIQRVLWKDHWKFAFNGFDFDELYDLEADPHEMENLINEPEHQALIKELMARVWAKIRDTGDKSIHETHYYPMRFGAVGPNAAA